MNDQIADRIKGTILAGACANSLGGACLGMNRKEIMFAVGIRGMRDFVDGHAKSLLPEHQAGNVLADTLLGLEVARSLIASQGKLDPNNLKDRFAKLLESKDFLSAAPGAHCLLPLRMLVDDTPVDEDGVLDSTHVNAAARALVIGCLPNADDVIQIACEQAKLTHADPRVCAAAAVLAHSVSVLVKGQKLNTEDEVRQYVSAEFAIAEKLDERFAEYWDAVAPDLDYATAHPAEDLPYSLINVDSHVNEAVPTAVGIFLIFRHDLEEAIAAAASAGGDTDTVAAIVGALSGAYHGAPAIPPRWLNKISRRAELEAVADELIGLWNSR